MMVIDRHRPVRRYRVLSRAVRRRSSEVAFELLEPRLSCSSTPATAIQFDPAAVYVLPVKPYPFLQYPSDNGLVVTSRLPSILDHRETYSGTLATFTDADAGNASDYSAGVDWGDGSGVETVSVTRDPATGDFVVRGTHTYLFGNYTPRITVTDLRAAGTGASPIRGAAVVPSLAVFPPPVAGIGYPVNATNGRTFRTTVARYVGLDTSLLSRYVARISWGDGQSDAGELVANPDGSVSVIGRHAYAEPGYYDVLVSLGESGAASAVDGASASRSRATVANGAVAGIPTGFEARSGVPFQGNVAFFKYLSDSRPNLDSLHAVVFFRDSGGETSVAGRIVPGTRGFFVSVDHMFPGQGAVPFEVRVYDDALPAWESADHLTGIFRGAIPVAAHLHVSPTSPFTATAGVAGRFLVGHVVSDDPMHLWDTTLTATINWGDGSDPSPGELVPTAGGGFDVYGTHTYGVTGRSYDVSPSVTVTETRTPAAPGLPQGTQTTSASIFAGYTRSHVNAGSFPGFFLFGAPNYGGGAAQIAAEAFTGTDVTDGDFTALATWGDGVVTPATITRIGDHLYIAASRNDLAPGLHAATLTVRAGAYEHSLDATVYILEPFDPNQFRLNATVNTVPTRVFRGTHFHGVIATFTLSESDPAARPEDFTVSLYYPWQAIAKVVTSVVRNDDGSFSVVVDFDAVGLTEESYFMPNVQIARGQRRVVAGWTLSVSADPTLPDIQSKSLNFRQRQAFTTTVATFTAPRAGGSRATPDRFAAVIEWGDGTTSAGVITKNWDGSFDVTGTKTYHKVSGSVAVRVLLTDSVTGRTVFAQTSLFLDHDPVEVSPGAPDVSAGGDGVVSGTLATFVDEDGPSSNPDRYRVYYAALIDWGDGRVSEGLVSLEADGSYAVRSSHTYETSGDFDISILVRRNTRYAPIPTIYWYDGYVMNSAITDAVAPREQSSDFTVRLRVSVRRDGSPAPAASPDKPTAPAAEAPSVRVNSPRTTWHRTPKSFRSPSHSPAVIPAPRPTLFSSLPVNEAVHTSVLDDGGETSLLDESDPAPAGVLG